MTEKGKQDLITHGNILHNIEEIKEAEQKSTDSQESEFLNTVKLALIKLEQVNYLRMFW